MPAMKSMPVIGMVNKLPINTSSTISTVFFLCFKAQRRAFS